MNIKKLGSSLAATTLLVGLSTVAMADCDQVISDIETLAVEVRCDEYPTDPDMAGAWPKGSAIWQKKGKGSLGCEVHESLGRQLNEAQGEPPLGRGNGKGNNSAAGAANDLRNGKFDSGIQHLQNFMDTIMYSAKLNGDFIAGTQNFDTAKDAADYFVAEAYQLQQDAIASCAP